MSRYAIIADIHANLHALHAVLGRIATTDVDGIICLGDIVGYGPEPEKCLDLVNRHCDVVVLGNHDLAVLDPRYAEGFNSIAKIVLQWTRDAISPLHLDTLGRIREIEYVGDSITCVHDNPMPSPMTYIYDQQVASYAFRAVDTPICLVGHTHVPMVFDAPSPNVEDHFTPQQIKAYLMRDGVEIMLEHGHRYICNPGSVGQPRDGDPRASFALLDLERQSFSVQREAYDIAAAQLASQRMGLPVELSQRLAIGA